ncbi:hypothetical protein [Chromobacterium vaccinii]|uniref:hypothetical protein n=1 Tax=Chromobacterium vaccinii TaxID=1108595 RepID=UPI000E165F57|nr:hypothetical protein [Chromobacterium vaccinii]SUX30694.1 Uncharacterised protein [Chromobacterium vaccinii]
MEARRPHSKNRDIALQMVRDNAARAEAAKSAAALPPSALPVDERRFPAQAVPLVAVDVLQARVLGGVRKEALADIQDAIRSMAATERAVNQLITLHGLELRALSLPQAGMLWHAIEIALAEGRVAKARLERGGLPLSVELEKQAPKAGAEERAA